MKWETLKQRVADHLYNKLKDDWANEKEVNTFACIASIGNMKNWKDSKDALMRLVDERVLNWDVRMVGKLRDLFPDAFPKQLRTGALFAEMEDSDEGDWVVFVK